MEKFSQPQASKSGDKKLGWARVFTPEELRAMHAKALGPEASMSERGMSETNPYAEQPEPVPETLRDMQRPETLQSDAERFQENLINEELKQTVSELGLAEQRLRRLTKPHEQTFYRGLPMELPTPEKIKNAEDEVHALLIERATLQNAIESLKHHTRPDNELMRNLQAMETRHQLESHLPHARERWQRVQQIRRNFLSS